MLGKAQVNRPPSSSKQRGTPGTGQEKVKSQKVEEEGSPREETRHRGVHRSVGPSLGEQKPVIASSFALNLKGAE